MKLRKIKKKINKLLQLQNFKSLYKRKSDNFGANSKQIEMNLHKILNIIYKFHVADKKILFLGFPTDFKKVLKNTKHVLIPEFVWFNGMLGNKALSINKTSKNFYKNVFKLISKLEKKLDLIVIFDLNKHSNVIKESFATRIVTVIFNFKETCDSAVNYSFTSEKLEKKFFIFSLVKSVLNKVKKKKSQKHKSFSGLRKIYRKKIRKFSRTNTSPTTSK